MKYRKLRYEIRNLRRGIPFSRKRHSYLISLATFIQPQYCRIIGFTFFALMLSIGSIPGEAQALSEAVGDKLLHLCAYSFLACALYGGTRGAYVSRAWQTLLWIAVLGATDELIQAFLPYRNANLVDWMVNMLAAGLTLAVLIAVSNTRHRFSHLSS